MKQVNGDLASKLQKQNELDGGQTLGGFDIKDDSAPGIPVRQPTSTEASQSQEPINWKEQVTPGPAPVPTQELARDETVPTESGSGIVATKDKIAEVEAMLGEAPQSISDATANARKFLDEMGDETFYIDNVSNGHVVVSDLDITIKRSKSEDLLRFATLEDLKKSRDLRAMLVDVGNAPTLIRLTPEEYLVKKRKEVSNKKMIEKMKADQATMSQQHQAQQQQGNQQNQVAPPQLSSRINPTILSKLEKLRLSTVPENAHLGMTPIEFVEWVVTEKLSGEELDFIASHPNVVHNATIRTAVFERKSQMMK